MLFLPSILVICAVGVAFGGMHRSLNHLLVPKRLFGYLAFCLLQQVGLNSYLTNRLLAALDSPRLPALEAATIFPAPHWPNPVLVPLTWTAEIATSWLFP